VSPPSSSPGPLPPLPPEPTGAGPGQPAIVWVGGTLAGVSADGLMVREPLGAEVSIKRLGRGATAFYRASRDRWIRLPPGPTVGVGEPACVETALEGRTLLALRVFLGTACGPSA